MKIDYCSDLHIDFWVREQNPQNPKMLKQIKDYIKILQIDKTESDTLIIAGDLGHYNQQDQAFLLECKKYYEYIILVRGNHDMYLVSEKQKKRYHCRSINRYLEMKHWCWDNGIHYLDGDIICIEGYKFAGVGMSWDKTFYEIMEDRKVSDNEILEFYKRTMNDSRMILDGGDSYSVPTTYGENYIHTTFDPLKYFKDEYNKLQGINDFDNIDVMVSHYVPINPYFDNSSDYANDLTSTFYMFDGKKDISRINPKFWIFGHMHKQYDFISGETRFLCNPSGYPGENIYCTMKTMEI